MPGSPRWCAQQHRRVCPLVLPTARRWPRLAAGSSPQAGRSPLVQEYETALKKGAVSFEQVVQAALGRRPTAPDGASRAVNARYYPRLLQGEDYRTIMETVFVVISYCMSSLDHERSGDPQPKAGERAGRERAEALSFLRSECARAEQDLDNIIHRRAERTYFNGMLGAVLALGVAGVVLAQSTLKNAIPLSGRSTARPDTHSPAPQPESKSLR